MRIFGWSRNRFGTWHLVSVDEQLKFLCGALFFQGVEWDMDFETDPMPVCFKCQAFLKAQKGHVRPPNAWELLYLKHVRVPVLSGEQMLIFRQITTGYEKSMRHSVEYAMCDYMFSLDKKVTSPFWKNAVLNAVAYLRDEGLYEPLISRLKSELGLEQLPAPPIPKAKPRAIWDLIENA